jgi:glycerophosphoryl diester phosphodiesterase
LNYAAHCLVGSFRPDWVADFHAACPQVGCSVLFGSKAIDGPRAVSLAQAAGASFVHPCWESDPHPSALLTPEWLSAVRAAGLKVITWHEERPAEIAMLQRLGVNGICSDRPELLFGAYCEC